MISGIFSLFWAINQQIKFPEYLEYVLSVPHQNLQYRKNIFKKKLTIDHQLFFKLLFNNYKR